MKFYVGLGVLALLVVSMTMKNVAPIGMDNDDTMEAIEVLFE